MNSHPGFSIINSVESVLISQKQPTKLLSDTKILVESKHVTDSVSYAFVQPSSQAMEKLSKLNPIQPLTVGNDPNANIRAFIMTSLEIAFNYSQPQFQSFYIDKIAHQNMQKINSDLIKNHNHDQLSSQNMLRVVVGFLRTLSNKKLKNPNMFDIKNQLQTLPIILDYLIIIFRAILNHFGIQNADYYQKTIKDNDVFNVLSQYFDLNYIKKENFYFFEEEGLFIFKNNIQFVIGKYQTVENREKKSNSLTSRKRSVGSNKYNHSQIMECSDEGSMLVSSRHDGSTPCFNQGEYNLNANDKNCPFDDSIREEPNYFNHHPSQSGHKSYESKSSGFQVNIYSEDKDKFFNTKYKSNHDHQKNRLLESHKQKVSAQNSFDEKSNKNNGKIPQKLHFFNAIQPQKSHEYFKKLSSDRNYFHPTSLNKEGEKLVTNGDSTVRTKQKFSVTNNHISSLSHLNNSLHDKIFQWQNQDRRLRRVETICYKTCSTCHRRFYRNQIQSNVLEVKITVDPKPKQVKNPEIQTPTQLFFKNTPDFLNKKFNKKLIQGLTESPNQKDRISRIKSPQKEKQKLNANPQRFCQFNWLNKRLKTQQNNQKVTSPLNTFPVSPKQKSQNNPTFQKSKNQQPKKALSIHNLFILNKDKEKSPQKSPNNAVIKVKVKENRKFSGDTYDLGLKPKYFTGLRSAKQLEKITSKEKFVFNRIVGQDKNVLVAGKSEVIEKALQNTNNSTLKDSSYPGRETKNNNLSMNNTSMQGVRSQGDINIPQDKKTYKNIQCNKSIQKRIPKFMVKKDSLNTEMRLIMNS